MIPSTQSVFSSDLEIDTEPSLNYKMDMNYKIINGYCDKLEAMLQTVYKILNTERYQHIIYSWSFGVELLDLHGEPVSYVCSELQRRITEALLQDDRIEDVDEFEFDVQEKRIVKATFTVHTIYGDIQAEKEVNF